MPPLPLGLVDPTGMLPRTISAVPSEPLLIDGDTEPRVEDAALFSPSITKAMEQDQETKLLESIAGPAEVSAPKQMPGKAQDGCGAECELQLLSRELPSTQFLCLVPPLYSANAGIVFRSRFWRDEQSGQLRERGEVVDTWPCVLHVKPDSWAATMTDLTPGCTLVSINGVPATTFEAAKAQLTAATSATKETATGPIKMVWQRPDKRPVAIVAALRAGLAAMRMVHRHEQKVKGGDVRAEACCSQPEPELIEKTTSAEKRRRDTYATDAEAEKVRAEFDVLSKRNTNNSSTGSVGRAPASYESDFE